ncbi:MAG TPA: O-antigen ligase family protein [Patescibacteria group bacterium]|nr:O-antigen ligase family protein [Patescibacteria group bacterium]
MTILAISLLGFALIAYFKPTFAVGLILALLPTYLVRFQFGALPTTLLELLLIVFLAVTLAKNFWRLAELKNLGKLNWFIAAFVLAGIISAAISPDRHAALGILKAFILEPVLFFYALRLTLRKIQDLTTPLNLMFLSAILISLAGILQYATFIHLPLRFWGTGAEVERITSVFDYPNALALYLAPLCSFFFAGFVFGGRVLNRKNLFIGLLIMIAALALTYSRGAWLAFAVSVLVILAPKYPIKKVALAAAAIAAVLLIIPQSRQRLALTAHDPSSEARIDLMQAAEVRLERNPILGNGLAGFRTTLEQQNFHGEILNYPHNIFFNFWIEMGALGLISFFAVMIAAIARWNINPAWFKTAALVYLLALFIHGLVDVPYFKNDLSILFWFVISIFYI